MAVDALEIVATHMNVGSFGRVDQVFIQVTMFYTVPATPGEMATATILTGWIAHTFGNLDKLYTFEDVKEGIASFEEKRRPEWKHR